MNSQEFDRHSVNEVVDEITTMELYGPPFGAAAAAGTSGFMCSCRSAWGWMHVQLLTSADVAARPNQIQIDLFRIQCPVTLASA